MAVAFGSQARAAAVDVRVEVPAGLPPVHADPALIRGVIGNLVSNALQHTPRSGTVQLRAQAQGDLVVVRVEDNGEGIPEELLPRVFERFVRGANSSGSGLGLAIAQETVRAHGGKLWIESARGQGTRAFFSLPQQRLFN